MNVIGLLRTLERITRPPTRPTFSDTDNPLAEYEAETECLVPEDFNAVCRCAACVAEERAAEDELSEPAECECWPVEKPWTYYGIVEPGGAMEFNPDCPVHGRDDIPNPTEPGLTPDELVAVRQLIEDRFGLADVPAPSPAGTGSPADDGHSPVPPAGERSRYDELGGGPW